MKAKAKAKAKREKKKKKKIYEIKCCDEGEDMSPGRLITR